MTQFVQEHEARWWHNNSDETVTCDLCPLHCKIRNNSSGHCGVRHVRNNRMYTLAYGKTSGVAVDPIEKKPLFHFLPGSKTLSFGTASCNLACSFCQNWTITKEGWQEALSRSIATNELVELAKWNACSSVSFTYNEPIISAEFVLDTAAECRKNGIRTVAVTNGFITPELHHEFFEVIDATNIDLKSFSNDFYRRFCGGSLQPVLDTLLHVANRSHTWLEITNLVIPGCNDSSGEIDAMTQWIAGYLGPNVPLHFSAFHPSYHLANTTSTPLSSLLRARDVAVKNGLKHVYIGNVLSKHQNTYCTTCNAVLIQREQFRMLNNRVETGKCPNCDTILAGIFFCQNAHT